MSYPYPPPWPPAGSGAPGPYWGPPAGYWGAPLPVPPPRRPRSRTAVALVVGGAVLAMAVVAVVVVAGIRIGRSETSPFAAAAPTTAPPSDPAGLGEDAALDEYAQQCHDGAMTACDDLLGLSPSGSAYQQYGMTCGGRVKAFELFSCTDLQGAPPTMPPSDPTGLGDDPGLDGYAQRCHDGVLSACDDLYQLSPPMSGYERYGMTCGGRIAPNDVLSCEDLEDD